MEQHLEHLTRKEVVDLCWSASLDVPEGKKEELNVLALKMRRMKKRRCGQFYAVLRSEDYVWSLWSDRKVELDEVWYSRCLIYYTTSFINEAESHAWRDFFSFLNSLFVILALKSNPSRTRQSITSTSSPERTKDVLFHKTKQGDEGGEECCKFIHYQQ